MIDKYLHYFDLCFHDVPASVGIGMLLLFLVGTLLLLALLGFKNGIRWSVRLLLLEYLLMLISLTVLFRVVRSSREFDFIPFWSYRAVWGGGHGLLSTQMIMNVVAFIPVGLLLGISFSNIKWWKALLIGGTFSLLIEMLQFFLRRGFAEFDDVFHNGLGCIIGYGVYAGLTNLLKRVRKRRVDQVC